MNKALFNENGYRKYIVFFFVLFLLLIVGLIFVFNRKTEYLIVNESFVITKKASKYGQLKKFDEKILDNKYNVYSDGVFYKDLTLKNNSLTWYYFDDDYKDLGLTKVSAAYTKKFGDLKVADYDVSFYTSEDDEILNSVLEGRDISKYKDSVIKSSFDLDNDGVLESIYTINNFNLADSNGSYSFIFLTKNDKLVKVIDKDKKDSFLVQGIFDLDGDGKFEVIISKGTNDVVTYDTCIKIYSLDKNKFVLNCK